MMESEWTDGETVTPVKPQLERTPHECCNYEDYFNKKDSEDKHANND